MDTYIAYSRNTIGNALHLPLGAGLPSGVILSVAFEITSKKQALAIVLLCYGRLIRGHVVSPYEMYLSKVMRRTCFR